MQKKKHGGVKRQTLLDFGLTGDQKGCTEIWAGRDGKMFLKMMSISCFNQFQEDSETEQLHHCQRIADYRSSCLWCIENVVPLRADEHLRESVCSCVDILSWESVSVWGNFSGMERVANKRTKDDILLPVFAARLRPSTECLGESLSFNMFLSTRVFTSRQAFSTGQTLWSVPSL